MNKTRALENEEVYQLFRCISGTFATRNTSMLICGIVMALRATELCQLNVGDIEDANGDIKTYVTIRAETAKRKKERKVRIGAQVRRALSRFIEYKELLNSVSTAELFIEIQQRGFDIDSLLEQKRNAERRASKVVSIDAIRDTKGAP